MIQYVYKALSNQLPITDDTDENIHIINGAGSCLKYVSYLKKEFSIIETIKILLKSISGNRVLIVYLEDDRIAAYCWLNYGFCKHYSIGKADVVIGPVMTDERSRGKGFATRLLKASFQYIDKVQMADAVYIDTAEDNCPMQAIIKKSGFGEPLFTYERTC